MTDNVELDARLAAIRDRTSHILAVASPSPDLLRANEAVHHAVAALLALHAPQPYYADAGACIHSEPEIDSPARDQWDADHPFGSHDIGRICKLTQTDRFCPACTSLAYEDEPVGDEYVPAGGCIVRPLFERVLTPAGSTS